MTFPRARSADLKGDGSMRLDKLTQAKIKRRCDEQVYYFDEVRELLTAYNAELRAKHPRGFGMVEVVDAKKA